MKKTFYILLCVLFSFNLTAQDSEDTYQGKLVLGGSVSFLTQNNLYPLGVNIYGNGGVYSNSSTPFKQVRFSFSPYIGKEINQNLLVGFQLNFRVENRETTAIIIDFPGNSKTETDAFSVGAEVFSRHQVLNFGSIGFYLQPYLGYNVGKTKNHYDDLARDNEIKTTYFNLGSGLGLLYNANDKIRLTLSTGGITYINGKWEEVNSENGNDFNSFQTDLRLSSTYLGIEFRF